MIGEYFMPGSQLCPDTGLKRIASEAEICTGGGGGGGELSYDA